MNLKNLSVALLVIIVILGGYGILKVTGIWDSASSNQPNKIEIKDSDTGESVEVYDIESLKGSSSFKDISQWFDIPLNILQEAFVVSDANIANFQNKDLESIFAYLEEEGKEIGNGSVKLFVALYKGIPYEISDDEVTYLPDKAVNILKEIETVSAENLIYIEKNMISTANIDIDIQEDIPVEETEENSDAVVFEIKGKTTFQEVIGWGISKEDIEKAIGSDIATTTQIIKEFCEEKTLDYETVKTQILDLLSN